MAWARAILGAATAAALAGVAFIALGTRSEDPPPPEEHAAQAPATERATQPPAAPPLAAEPPPAPPTAGPAAEQAAAPPPVALAQEATAAAPTLDVARIEPDGQALFAGRAQPNSEVEIRIGAAVAATAQAGADGAFVAFGTVAPDEGLRRLEVIARAPDGAARETAPVFVAPAPDNEPEARASIIQARPQGVAILQTTPRPADEPVTLDLVSYDEDGEVELGGRGEPLRPLRVFANALLIAETSVRGDGGWSARPGLTLAPGLYTLRVEALGEDGSVRHVVESPFRREGPDAMALQEGQVVIQPGDTLWRLAENLYGAGVRYTVIYQANTDRIRDPDLIYPGQVFVAPPPAQ